MSSSFPPNDVAECHRLMALMQERIKELEEVIELIPRMRKVLEQHGKPQRDALETLGMVYYGDYKVRPPYLTNEKKPSEVCKRMFHHDNGIPTCCSATPMGDGSYTALPYAKHPLECSRLWIDDSCDPNTELPDIKELRTPEAIAEVVEKVRSKHIIPYSVCSQCWLPLSFETGFNFPVKTKYDAKHPCVICLSKGCSSTDRSSGMCSGCRKVIVDADKQVALFSPVIALLNSAYGLGVCFGIVNCMDKFVDDVIHVSDRLCICIEKDTDGHRDYVEDKEFDRLKLLIDDRKKHFQQVIVIRYNPNGDRGHNVKPAIASCIARQWVIHAALHMKLSWAVVYLMYPPYNKHLARARASFPSANVVVANGPPTRNNGRAVYAMSVQEFEQVAASGLEPLESPLGDP